MINIRFNDEAAVALKKYIEEKELKDVEILYSPYYINDGFYLRAFKGRE